MDARPEIPDPQHDRHVAFPEERPEPLPAGWWAPTPSPPRPPRPAPAAPSGAGRTSRRSTGWWFLLAALLLGGFMSQADSDGGPFYGRPEVSQVEQSGAVHLTPDHVGFNAELLPEDAPLFRIPSGTTTFRLEVVGTDPRAGLEVGTQYGTPQGARTVSLPFWGELTRDNADDVLSVTVTSAYAYRQVQCRVYLGPDLVAIGTGQDRATCEVPTWR
ncbi:MAG: hypothetical protein ACTHJJ_03675 [Intrasporangium sp.]|uniref:hypothetical protein n=1 Tax=Intrasporangium sp. TaxID=1925024 RepID=UPI003F7F37DA